MKRLWRWLGGADRAGRSAVPAGELFHPITLACLVLLVVNDRVLKGSAVAGWWTGKLSDVVGLASFPLVVTAALDTAAWLARLPVDFTLRRWKLGAAIATTGIGFTVIKVWPAAGARVASWLGAVFGDAAIVPDRTDLFALPALAVAWWIGTREIARVPLGRLEHLRKGGRGLDDVVRCGGSRDACARLEAAIAADDAPAIDAALRELRS